MLCPFVFYCSFSLYLPVSLPLSIYLYCLKFPSLRHKFWSKNEYWILQWKVTWSFLYVRLCDCECATDEAHSKLRTAQWQTCILSSIYCACSLGWSLSGSLWIGASRTNNVRTVSVLQDASGVPNRWVFSSLYEMHVSFDFFHTPTWTLTWFIPFTIHISCTSRINLMLWYHTIIPSNTNFGTSQANHSNKKKRMHFFLNCRM